MRDAMKRFSEASDACFWSFVVFGGVHSLVFMMVNGAPITGKNFSQRI
jgi:lipid-A-disaccharide synthase-like uncharacterized protein